MPGVAPKHTPVQSTKGRQNFYEEAARVQASSRARAYESHEFDVPGLATSFSLLNDLDHAANCTCGRASGAFFRIDWADRVIIRNRGVAPLSVEFVTDPNSSEVGDISTIEDGENFNFDLLEVYDLKFTNENAGVSRVKILLA